MPENSSRKTWLRLSKEKNHQPPGKHQEPAPSMGLQVQPTILGMIMNSAQTASTLIPTPNATSSILKEHHYYGSRKAKRTTRRKVQGIRARAGRTLQLPLKPLRSQAHHQTTGLQQQLSPHTLLQQPALRKLHPRASSMTLEPHTTFSETSYGSGTFAIEPGHQLLTSSWMV